MLLRFIFGSVVDGLILLNDNVSGIKVVGIKDH